MKPLHQIPHLSAKEYEMLYEQSIQNPEGFWRAQLDALDWIQRPTKISRTSFKKDTLQIKWFEDGILNVSSNCIDRHLATHGDHTALLFIGNEKGQAQEISFKTLHQKVCRYANVLKNLGVVKGDRVALYMPMIPEAAYVMLACTRIGAVHSVVFGGFSASALAGRIDDCGAKIIVTADQGKRGDKIIPLKETVDRALSMTQKNSITHCLMVRHTGADVPFHPDRDIEAQTALDQASDQCPPEPMNAEDPLFILYTSGSTGKPKGVLHTTGGYLLYAMLTHRIIFDIEDQDRYWCTADVGWITGHSYMIYGPLANRTTTVLFEGVPNYPTPARFWEEIDTHKITKFYTAPTAIRALMREGDAHLDFSARTSLKVLGSVGEPLNPEAYSWYREKVGRGQTPIVDTWWQTETGGIVIAPLPHTTTHKAGSVTKPFFGISPALLDAKGQEIQGEGQGNLVLKASWPGQMRGVYGDSDRFYETYFKPFPGVYTSGDGARRDQEGDYWITGRTDDVINVSGHRIGSAEVEAAINAHAAISESAVIGIQDEITGEALVAFAITKHGQKFEPSILKQDLINHIRSEIGPLATPKQIQLVPGLPKTRSGKIMRRILRALAEGDTENLGDTSTLAEPKIVETLRTLLKNTP